MNKYELGVIVRADLDEESYRAEMDRVKALIDRFGGTIDAVDEWGRRKLAYPIQKLTEGMYNFISYSATGTTASDVESRLRLMENVLRFLTIRKDENEAPVEKKPKVKKSEKPAEPKEVEVSEEPAESVESVKTPETQGEKGESHE